MVFVPSLRNCRNRLTTIHVPCGNWFVAAAANRDDFPVIRSAMITAITMAQISSVPWRLSAPRATKSLSCWIPDSTDTTPKCVAGMVQVVRPNIEGRDRHAFQCPHCGGQTFEVTVGFVFWYPGELAEEFDGDWQDLFIVFLCYCQCAACGQFSQPTDLGKL